MICGGFSELQENIANYNNRKESLDRVGSLFLLLKADSLKSKLEMVSHLRGAGLGPPMAVRLRVFSGQLQVYR